MMYDVRADALSLTLTHATHQYITDAYALFRKNCGDLCGHGTHMSGIIGSKTFGVAKEVTMYALKVIAAKTEFGLFEDPCSGGSAGGVLKALEWLIQEKKKKTNENIPFVCNMSLELAHGIFSEPIAALLKEAYELGIVFVVAAGNYGVDACDGMLTSSEYTISVAATDMFDRSTPYSNFGSCVQIYAPGDYIRSTFIPNYTSEKVQRGTSIAAAFVSGAAALVLEANPAATPAEVWEALRGAAQVDVVKNVPEGTPNLLLNIAALH